MPLEFKAIHSLPTPEVWNRKDMMQGAVLTGTEADAGPAEPDFARQRYLGILVQELQNF